MMPPDLTPAAPPPPNPLPRDLVLSARMEALRSAALTSERSVPAEVVTDRAGEFEAWLIRGLATDDDGW